MMSSTNSSNLYISLVNAVKYGQSRGMILQLVEKIIETTPSLTSRYKRLNAVEILQSNVAVCKVTTLIPLHVLMNIVI